MFPTFWIPFVEKIYAGWEDVVCTREKGVVVVDRGGWGGNVEDKADWLGRDKDADFPVFNEIQSNSFESVFIFLYSFINSAK